MLAQLDVPYLGTATERARQEASKETITILLPIRGFVVENNNHNHADTCRVTLDWRDASIDTRLLDDGVLTLFCADADEFGNFEPNEDNTIFIGHVRNPERELQEGELGTLTIEAIDYTGLFLDAKPFGSSGIPLYSDTLEGAWRRICSQTPGAAVLADRLVSVGTDVPLDALLGKAVSERFAKLSRVPTHPDTDAWAVWQQCVGMLGLISFIDQDVCVVTSATNFYTERDPPVFTWGNNLISLSESRMNVDVKGGVGLVSFDPESGQAIEAFFPPIGDSRVQRKLTAAKRKKKNPPPSALSGERDKRHIFTMWGVTDLAQLEMIAERVWTQISRQELSGKLVTPHMRVQRRSGRDFNVLKLRSGDDIVVDFDQGQNQYLSSLSNEAARYTYLTSRGYTSDVARLLAKNVEALVALGNVFFVDSVRKEMELTEDGGTFRVEVSFLNKIEVSRGAVGRTAAEERATDKTAEQLDFLFWKEEIRNDNAARAAFESFKTGNTKDYDALLKKQAQNRAIEDAAWRNFLK